jgi:hypothetical protein
MDLVERVEQLTKNPYVNVSMGTAVLAVLALGSAKWAIGRHSVPGLTEHVGDYPFVFTPLALGGALNLFYASERYAAKCSKQVVQKIGRYLPELTALALTTYCTLGETVFPKLLLSTADVKDIPVIFLGGITGCWFARWATCTNHEDTSKNSSYVKDTSYF